MNYNKSFVQIPVQRLVELIKINQEEYIEAYLKVIVYKKENIIRIILMILKPPVQVSLTGRIFT